MNVLFVCIQNAGRSQIAEALFAREAAGRHEARSAGSSPATRVHPEVSEVMRETAASIEGRVDRALERCFTTKARTAAPRPKVTKTAAPAPAPRAQAASATRRAARAS